MFEFANKNAIFGAVPPSSPLYAPILLTFAVTGIPSAGAPPRLQAVQLACAGTQLKCLQMRRLCRRLLVSQSNQFGKPGGRAPRQSRWVLGNQVGNQATNSRQHTVIKECASATTLLCMPRQARQLKKQEMPATTLRKRSPPAQRNLGPRAATVLRQQLACNQAAALVKQCSAGTSAGPILTKEHTTACLQSRCGAHRIAHQYGKQPT